MSVIEIPELCLVVLVGVTGSGKTTFAHRHFADTEILSSDALRGMVADDPTDQSATVDAFAILADIAGRRLTRGLLTVVDATSLRPEDRATLLAIAKDHDVFSVAVVLDVPADELRRRAHDRTDIDTSVVERQHRLLRKHSASLRKEGFRFVHVLEGVDAIDATEVTRTRLFNDRRDEHGPFDIIGDVHGCAGELHDLLLALGWTLRVSTAGDVLGVHDHPDGRRVVFVGDLVDRGPDTPAVLALVMSMVTAGQALCVRGNHEEKLLRVLRRRAGTERAGGAVTLTNGLAESLTQLDDTSDAFRADVVTFLDGLVSHYVFDDGHLVVSHAGLAQRYHGRTSGRVRNLAMYGETTGEKDRWGHPIRVDWARDYRGEACVVYGHTPTPAAAWVNNTLCVDTGCVFGGALTALRYPELTTVSVPARTTHWASEEAMGYGDTPADALLRSRLRLDDVTGKRTVRTGYGPPITIRADNAAAALEVMSRFALDPRWLRYLPPTMSPASSDRDDLLESPCAAFGHYAEAGVGEVMCEEKHMGSRAVVVIARDQEQARAGFDVDGAVGAIYTRTGRSFFDPATTAVVLDRARAAAEPVMDRLGCGWLILDAELLPWNIKGEALIRDEFAAVSAAAIPELDVLDVELGIAASRGLDVTALRAGTSGRRADIDAFTASYMRYVDPAATPSDVRLAVFEVIAAGGADSPAATFENRSHAWHLEMSDALVASDPTLFASTRRLLVDTGSEQSCARGQQWWTTLTADGAEGMVVKPAANLTRDRRGRMVLPGIKVRGAEYLRIIYGPGYRHDLARLRSRDLRHKRSMAMREYQLGREAVARHVAGAPLWKVHEFVFAVLALESEPVDVRL